MLSEVIGRVVDRQSWLDSVGNVLEQVAGGLFDHLGPASRPVEDLLHGTPAGHPLHPALVAVPIGTWTATLALDIAGLDEAADLMVDVGLVAALSSAVVGIADWRYTVGTQRRMGVAHALLNITATTLYGISAWQRRTDERIGAKTTANLGYACVLAAGYLGGDLAYALGVMVNRNAWMGGAGDFVPVAEIDDLPEDKPTRAEADGESLVLVRRGNTVYALGESCAHLGGPLSEGSLEGDTIVCPWHGSTFALDDGHAVTGPTAYNQPCYAVRIRQGKVEVKLGGEYAEREPYYRVRGQAEPSKDNG
jgi:nitrite reductase/ring-hydroxylating ferredoxin subunit/uncharacterized membrane protein